MKILVGGCSFSTGHGLADGRNNPSSWPNLLAAKFDADLKNVAVSGYDNQGIFLNLVKECTSTHYDLILFQVTSLSRIAFSPNIHGIVGVGSVINADSFHGWDSWFTLPEWETFRRLCVKFNGPYEHWRRLLSIIITCQNLISQGYNIKFVNGLLHWQEEFFTADRSKWADRLIDRDSLPDNDIDIILKEVNQTKKQINLKHWINPFEPLVNLKVDDASNEDPHPGLKSQQIFTNLIFNSLTSIKEE